MACTRHGMGPGTSAAPTCPPTHPVTGTAAGDVEVVLGDDAEAVEVYLAERARQEAQWQQEHAQQAGQRQGVGQQTGSTAAGQAGGAQRAAVCVQERPSPPGVVRPGPLGQ